MTIRTGTWFILMIAVWHYVVGTTQGAFGSEEHLLITLFFAICCAILSLDKPTTGE